MSYAENYRGWKTADQINESMARVYGHMGLAVLLSMVVSYFVSTNAGLMNFFFTGAMKWVTIFAPLVAIVAMSFALNSTTSKTTAQLMLYGFAALMGLSFATIFIVYKIGSIMSAFGAGAILFGVMSLWGYFTKTNLDSFGKFLFVGLIALIIASIVNIFLGNSLFSMVISAVAIIVFLGLTAYDTQKIREMVSVNSDTGSSEVIGALTLYMDFINIFLALLNLTGDKKE